MLGKNRRSEGDKTMTILRFLAFALSSLGWWTALQRRTGAACAFLPSLTVALQGIFLFFCGLLNLLPEGVWGLLLGGLAALALTLRREKGSAALKPFCDTAFLFFAAALALMGFSLRGRIFTHYDNFTHWALVVRNMLETDRFPNFRDSLLIFQAYPLGSAAFVYFFSKIVGPGEGVQMLAQCYMNLACILPLFSLGKKNSLPALLLTATAANFFLTYNIAPNDLLVDTLLPLLGMCGALFAAQNCKRGCKGRELFFAACYGVFVTQIKNSGVFFAGIIGLALLKNAGRESVGPRTAAALSPALPMLLWNRHCAYVFPAAAETRHALTLTNFRATLGGKTGAEMLAVAKAMVKFSLTWRDVWLTALLFALLGALVFLFVKGERRTWGKALLLAALFYAAYQIGMLGMYLFSMPEAEASTLAGADRYTRSILIAAVYLFTAAALKTLARLPKGRALLPSALLSLALCGVLFLTTGQLRLAPLDGHDFDPATRRWIEEAAQTYAIPEGSSACVLIPEPDAGYANFVTRYVLRSGDVLSFVADEEGKLDGVKNDYILLYDDIHPAIPAWVAAHYPEQLGERVIVQRDLP